MLEVIAGCIQQPHTAPKCTLIYWTWETNTLDAVATRRYYFLREDLLNFTALLDPFYLKWRSSLMNT